MGRHADAFGIPWDAAISKRHLELTALDNGRARLRVLPAATNPMYLHGEAVRDCTLVLGEHVVIGKTRLWLGSGDLRSSVSDRGIMRSGSGAAPVRSKALDQASAAVSSPATPTPRPGRTPGGSSSGVLSGDTTDGDLLPEHTPHGEPSADRPAVGVTEWAYDANQLRSRHFRDAPSRIEALSRLPDLIAGCHSDDEMLVRVVQLVLAQTPQSDFVAVVQWTDEGPRTLHTSELALAKWTPSAGASNESFISHRLLKRAVESGQSILHHFDAPMLSPTTHRRGTGAGEFTELASIRWAMAVPVRPDSACRGWAIYAAGRDDARHLGDSHSEPEELSRRRDDMKFAEVVASLVGNLRQSRQLQRRQNAMRPFFSSAVAKALEQDVDDVFRPRAAELSVLFCDLRNFTGQSDRLSDNLMELVGQVSHALSLVTRAILAHDGVIGDFHGDAVMGFWGWPLATPDAADRAVAAAIDIRDAFRRDATTFRCGVGIASGPAVAGGIGTTDQIKVTAIGPSVNRAARLEDATKRLDAAILMDAATVQSAQPPPGHRFEDRGPIELRGFQAPERVFSLAEH